MNQDADKLVGARLQNRFDIISILGTGASSTVYKANHLLLDQLVAIKVLHSVHSDSQQSQQRFQKEATVLNSFTHPNIVRFFSFGSTDDGRNFMVLEFLEGKTLAEILKEKEALSMTEAMPIFKDICKGLSYAHEHDVIHRDLKPGNVINVSGENDKTLSKILDFGVVKTTREDLSMTKTGTLIGSANYMSPEQCSSKEIGKSTDIYSMGCLMYETLVGAAPMQAETDLLTMSNHLNKTVKYVPAKHGISRELERIILRCLEKDSKKRYSNSSELLSALEAADGTPIAKAPKHTGMLIALAIGLIAILVTTVTF
ncbi:MAG: serine/threonine protein kinase, partial [Candidatus Obscuribacterales bacterium]|nr:serine/threonine protein kinase [Candidatus Obscuribacterales bacterium]